jgi:hypothetical protein
VHDLNSFQGKSVKNHKLSFISTLIFKINQGMEIRLANIYIHKPRRKGHSFQAKTRDSLYLYESICLQQYCSSSYIIPKLFI